jgi:hypothetical protein
MGAVFTFLRAVPEGVDVNVWGMLGCAVAYAAALFAAVDGLGDALLQRDQHTGPRAKHALQLKVGSKVAAAGITVVTAGIVLLLDTNYIAFALLSAVFVVVVAWVAVVYRRSGRSALSYDR